MPDTFAIMLSNKDSDIFMSSLIHKKYEEKFYNIPTDDNLSFVLLDGSGIPFIGRHGYTGMGDFYSGTHGNTGMGFF